MNLNRRIPAQSEILVSCVLIMGYVITSLSSNKLAVYLWLFWNDHYKYTIKN